MKETDSVASALHTLGKALARPRKVGDGHGTEYLTLRQNPMRYGEDTLFSRGTDRSGGLS